MGFSLQLAQDLIEVEAGGNSPVAISVTNRGEGTDSFELEIEGLDPDWKAIPVPTFPVEAGETRSERAFFKPPRVSESVSGNYPFVVRVRSLESGEQKTVQGVLQLKPFNYLTMEISPKKGLYSWSTHRNTFDILLANLGNTDHTLQLTGGDPEDSCIYEFDSELVTLTPGQQKEVSVTVSPVSSPILAGSKLIGFSIQARSTNVPSVAAAGQAQLERRSLLNPTNLTLLVVLLLLFGAWLVMKPKPPQIAVSVNPIEGMAGSTVVVSWEAKDAERVTLFAVDSTQKKTQIYDGSSLASSQQLVLGAAGNESIFAQIGKGATQGPSRLVATIQVDTPPPAVEPKIDSFSGSTHKVKVPGEVIFTWSVKDAAKIALTPDYPDLDPAIDSQSVTIMSPEEKDYQLKVWSKDQVVKVSKKWHVSAYQESEANIISFSVTPNSVPPGTSVAVSWNVVNDSELSLKYAGQRQDSLPQSGSQQVTVNKDTEFVLTAIDKNNIPVSKKITVHVQMAPTPTTPPSNPTDSTTTGGENPARPSDPSNGQNDGGNPTGPTTGQFR